MRIAALGGATALLLTGSGVALAAGDDGANETPITDAALVRAEEAALAETGGGRVTATEVEDEESAYEVEVTFGDGCQVDVQLDANFRVVSNEADEADGAFVPRGSRRLW